MKLSTAAVSLVLASASSGGGVSAFSPSGLSSGWKSSASTTFVSWSSSTTSPLSSSSSSTRSPISSSSSSSIRRSFGARRNRGVVGGADVDMRMLKPNAMITEEEVMLTNGQVDLKNLNNQNPFAIRTQDDMESTRTSILTAQDVAKGYLSKYSGESGASIIYTKLQEHGVNVVNGYSGGAVLPLLDQFHPQHPRHTLPNAPSAIRWITNSNENSAGHIAEGYAKSAPPSPIDGKQPAGVTVVTSGPGVTNLITPLQDAMCDGVPMVVLAGQAATTAPMDAFQQAPAVDLTRPCTKWSYQIRSAAELPFVMDYAFFIARNGRPGPVFIDLPKDLLNQVIDEDLANSFASSIPVKDSLASQTSDSEDGMLRLVPRYQGINGDAKVVDHVLHLGPAEKGILFQVEANAASLQPVPDMDLGGDEGVYQKDHHPSNTVHHHSVNDNSRQTDAQTGDLSPESPMTQRILNLIQTAQKPIIIAGQGCNDCPAELKEFAEALQIPVTTTLHGLGCFDERHELALNMLGMHGHPTPNYMIQDADLVINIGSRFDDRITGRIGDFIPEAKLAAQENRGGIVHVDIRLSEQAKQVQPTFFVHSTGKQFLQTMNNLVRTQSYANNSSHNTLANSNNTQQWRERMTQLQSDFPVKVPKFPTEYVSGQDSNGNQLQLPRTRMSAQSAITELNRQILAANQMDNCLFSTGVGIHQMVAAQLLTWTQPRQMITSGSLGTMGVALGFVIGCKLANEGKMCIAIDGDGSFNMTFTELKTVAEQKIPIKIMILDNESQMMVEYWQRLFHEERYLAVTNTVNPNYGKLAESFGIKNLYVDAQEDLESVMKQFLFDDPEEPVLLHVRIERTPCLPLVAPGKPLQEMILEDVVCDDLDACAAPS